MSCLAAHLDELGACLACGAALVMRVVCFARCPRCRAENYLPSAGDGAAQVARFWRRWTAPASSRGGPHPSGDRACHPKPLG